MKDQTIYWFALIMMVSPVILIGNNIPWEEGEFKGRIAISTDGNYNDEDDWAAGPFALAFLAEFELQDKLVHFDYNCIIPKTDPKWERTHKKAIEESAERYGFPTEVFHNCQEDLEAAINSIADAVNQSSAEDPLYFILAGPMEVPYLGISRADPKKRKFVYCISHNVWNDGYASAALVNHNKRDVIPTGVTWIQITDQNQFLSTGPFGRPSNEREWEPWVWLRDSADPNLNFLWDKLRTTTRADCSDAGMTYFLLTGDERPEISKVKALLEDHQLPEPLMPRDKVRLEAENFHELSNFKIDYRNHRQVSQRINIMLSTPTGLISTKLKEPYLQKTTDYDIEIRHSDKGSNIYQLFINDHMIREWQSLSNHDGWVSQIIPGITLSSNDLLKLVVKNEGESKIDYIQLNQPQFFLNPEFGFLDDPEAMPGQVIVAGSNPGYLKYNGGGPVFLSGPDNPEAFLFQGTLNPDGTRSGGNQEQTILKMARNGVNAFHCQMFRMQRCNIKNEGDDTHAPFNDHDPAKGLNPAVLEQWDSWLDLFEQHGIIVHLEFYNDATDVEMMGWTLDENGELHADEKNFIEGVVNKFKHHKNIIWGIEESCNKLPRSRTPHFKILGELIAKTDNYHHPIVQSFVIPEDPDGDFPDGGGTPDDYIGDPNIKVVTWLHLVPHGDDYEAQHQEYLRFYKRDSRNFIVMKNETFHHPRKGPSSRIYMWSCAMAAVHTLEAYHHADTSPDAILFEDGLVNKFMERTEFHIMEPRDDLALGSTKWVLARPGESYVGYTYDYKDHMGFENLVAGKYDLLWFDTVTGAESGINGVEVDWGDAKWKKPEEMGNEVVLYLRKSKE